MMGRRTPCNDGVGGLLQLYGGVGASRVAQR